MGTLRRPTYTDKKTGAQRTSQVWWIRYYAATGKRVEESSHSTKETVARHLLKRREGAVANGETVIPAQHRLTFDTAAQTLLDDYTTNNRRSVAVVRRRLVKHLRPFFGGRRLASITTTDIRAYVAHRQAQGIVAVRGARTGERLGAVSNGEINRELQHLKRIFSLALQAEQIMRRPYIPLLKEASPRSGFFERNEFEAVRAQLSPPLQAVVTFAYITGWRVPSEVLPLQWANVDLRAGTVTLDFGVTKNEDARTFPFTTELRAVLEDRQAARDTLRAHGVICPWVFFRLVAQGRGGPSVPTRIVSFAKAWRVACRAAGLPGKIPHDFRRTAVRNLTRASVPEQVAMRLTGHKTRSVFDRYRIVSEGDLFEAAAKLDALETAPFQGKFRDGDTGSAAGRTRNPRNG